MRRTAFVGVVLAFAVLLVTAPVAAQSEQLAVVSQHTSNADFDSGDLDGVSVQGTGGSAVVAATTTQTYNQSASNVGPTSSQPISVDGDFDPDGPDGSDTPELSVTGSSNSYSVDELDGVRIHDRDNDPAGTEWVIGDIPNDTISAASFYISDRDATGTESVDIYIAKGDTKDGHIGNGTNIGTCTAAYNTDPTWCDLSTDIDVSGYDQITIEMDGAYYMDSEAPAILESSTPTAVSVSDGAGESVNFGDFADGETKTRDIQLSRDSSTLDWSAASADGSLNWILALEEVHYDGEGAYTSANHTASNAEQGFANLTLEGATATVNWEYYDGSSWQVATSNTYSSTGNHTADISAVEADKWRTSVTFSDGSGDTTAHLNDEGVLFDARSPNINNPSPTGSKGLDNDSADLTADISDADFGTAQGDHLQATWYYGNGTQIDSQTITSNGTYETTLNELDGDLEWYLTVDDSYGQSTRSPSSGTHGFKTPDTLYIYNETSPNELVTGNDTDPVSVEVTFYDNSDVITKTTTDGQINLTGLDPNQQFIVTVDADGYFSRRIVVDSLYDQQSVYLLARSQTNVSPTYVLNDNTGNFPPQDTILQLEAPITKDFDGDGDNETSYQTILGDTFGAANEYPTTIRPDIRYRLIVRSGDQQRELGSHTVSSSGTVPVPIGEVIFEGEAAAQTSSSASMFEENGTRYVQFTHIDKQDATENLSYEIVRSDSPGVALQPNTTVSGPFGKFQTTIAVPGNAPDNISYTVRYHAERAGQDDTAGEHHVGSVPNVADDLPIDPQVLQLSGYVFIVAIMGFVVIFDDRLAGIAGVSVATALTWFGVVSIPAVGLGVAGATAVLYMVGRGRYA